VRQSTQSISKELSRQDVKPAKHYTAGWSVFMERLARTGCSTTRYVCKNSWV